MRTQRNNADRLVKPRVVPLALVRTTDRPRIVRTGRNTKEGKPGFAQHLANEMGVWVYALAELVDMARKGAMRGNVEAMNIEKIIARAHWRKTQPTFGYTAPIIVESPI